MLLLTSVGTTLAFQTSSNNHPGGNGRSSGYSPSSWTRLAANTDGGMDALTAQLQAAYAQAAASTNTEIESSNALVEDYANEMMNESRSAATAATTEPKIGEQAIASLLMQRAIQTQLYYLSDLRDEPTYMWLREFLNQDHLDDKGRFNEPKDGGWQHYLKQLEQAPHFTITVQLDPISWVSK